MDEKYLEQKQKEIMACLSVFNIARQKKYLKMILEAVWLAGKIEGIQKAREAIR